MKNKMLSLSTKYILPILIVLSTIDEIVRESEMEDKMDDIAYFIIAIVWIAIGLVTKWKMPKILPIVLFVGALLTKIIALVIERDDFTAVDHDYVILALMAIWVVVWFFWKRKKT